MSSNNILFVGNLSYDWSPEQMKESLQELFSQQGTIKEISVPTDRETGRHRGFAFVTYEDSNVAAAARDTLQGQPFGPNEDRMRDLKIDFAIPKEERREY